MPEDHPTAPEPTPQPSHRARGVWLLNMLLVGAGIALLAHVDLGAAPLATPRVPWWALALCCALAERCVVHLHFRRGAHSFSLGEMPVVFGLIFSTPADVIVAVCVSSAVVMVFERKLPPIKAIFNIAQFTLAAILAVIVFRSFSPVGAGATAWVAALVAKQAGGLVTVAAIAAAISLSEGRLEGRIVGQMVFLDAVVALTNTSLALTAAVVAAADPRGLVLLVIPMATVFWAYRSYQSEREQQKSLELMFETTRSLSRSSEVAGALEELLARSLEAFRASSAEIVLFRSDTSPPLRTALADAKQRIVMEPVEDAVADELRALVRPENPVALLDARTASPALAAYLSSAGMRVAMVAVLSSDRGPLGALVLADREGVVRAFGPDDLRLFEALANNASVALQYDQLGQAVTELRTVQEELEHQAFHDPLTHLPNRALFLRRVEAALVDPAPNVAVLFIDVDDFKSVNDTLGHDAGDELLVAVAGRLAGCVRPTDTVARFGGDEFALLVHEAGRDGEAGVAAGERVLSAFARPISIDGRSVDVHTSVGVAVAGTGATASDLLRHADLAMYSAKQQGKNRMRLFDPSMSIAVAERRGLRDQIERAIARREFLVSYQPIVSLETDAVTGAEALVRWSHPDRGLVAPADFIPLAEETGLIVAVGALVLGQACRQASAWERLDPALAPLSMHVNLSSAELIHPELPATVAAALRSSGLAPTQLVVEVTERVLEGDPESAIASLRRLRHMGVRIALDDFGTGLSSLTRLRSLPLDLVKIAKPLVHGVTSDSLDGALVRGILDLARNLGLEVIAEGIETQEQASALRRLRCATGQGFHIGHPLGAMDERPLILAAPAPAAQAA